jgi:hypothetical protein
MKTLETVQTEKRAIEILQNWLTINMTDDNMSADTVIDSVDCECGCGHTYAMRAFYEVGDKVAVVAVCDCCGDDDNMANVINQF